MNKLQPTIYRIGDFDSAHQLEGHPKCGFLHGHTYKYEVWITGKMTGEFNFVVDFHEITDYFKQFDHSNNILKMSCEKMTMDAVEHFYKISSYISKVKVRIWETPTSYAEYERE